MREDIKSFISGVSKPARYIGSELHSVIKDPAQVAMRIAFCFPDLYEVGMSHLGMKILYSLYNAQPDIWCEQTVSSALAGQDAVLLRAIEHLEEKAGER